MNELKGKFAEIFGARRPVGRRDGGDLRGQHEYRLRPVVPRVFPAESSSAIRRRWCCMAGYAAWTAAGAAGQHGDAGDAVARRRFPVVDTGSSMMINRDEMLAALGDDSIVKLDVRDVDEWVGTSSSPYGKDFLPRKGRIPGSKWIEWYRLMKPSAAGTGVQGRRKRSWPSAIASGSTKARRSICSASRGRGRPTRSSR